MTAHIHLQHGLTLLPWESLQYTKTQSLSNTTIQLDSWRLMLQLHFENLKIFNTMLEMILRTKPLVHSCNNISPFSLCFLCHYDDLGWTFVVSNPMARTNLMAKVSWALIWELNFLKAWPIDWWSSYNEPRSIDEL